MVRLRRVIFISQRQAERMQPPRSACIISITDPQRAEAQLQPGWLGTLRLAFHDVDTISFPGANRDLQPLSGQQADGIADFIQQHSLVAMRLVVHCRHGISRSSAVAKAVCDHLQLPFPASYQEFNREVHQRVMNALQARSA